MNNRFLRLYPILLVALMAGASIAVYQRLPERMPIHFDFDGNANGWAPRAVGAFLPPALVLFLWAILTLAPTVDPRRDNYARFQGAYSITVGAILLLVFAIHFIVLATVLGYPVPIRRVLPVMMGVLFLVIGNVMPRARSNFMYGIRTPWTLSSDRVWASTHRLAGYLLAIAGLAMIAAGTFMPRAFTPAVIITALAAAFGVPMVYSYFAWRKERQP